jgi:uncharacterized protein with HEPN domain
MRSRSAVASLTDIKSNIALARKFVADLTIQAFKSDLRTVYAVTRCLEIISEASRRLPTDLKKRHPSIPWADIAGAGSIYRHDYENVSDELLWNTVQNRLEALSGVVEAELRRLGSD